MAEFGIEKYMRQDRAAQGQAVNFQQTMAMRQYALQKKQYEDQAASAAAAGEGLSGMIDQYNQSYDEAKTANEQRYQAMLGIADQTTGQRQADITSAYGQQSSDIMQRLARLGLSNTTIAPTMGMGVEREKQESLNRAADEMQGTKLGIMERRTDEYPQSDIIMQLLQSIGQGSGGAAGGGIAQALSSMRLG